MDVIVTPLECLHSGDDLQDGLRSISWSPGHSSLRRRRRACHFCGLDTSSLCCLNCNVDQGGLTLDDNSVDSLVLENKSDVRNSDSLSLSGVVLPVKDDQVLDIAFLGPTSSKLIIELVPSPNCQTPLGEAETRTRLGVCLKIVPNHGYSSPSGG